MLKINFNYIVAMKNSISENLPSKFTAVSIIEDNHYMRRGWRAILDAVDDFVVLGDYENCESAFAAPDIGDSDVVLMDIGLPGMSGIEGVKYLQERNPGMAIVMCTVHDDDQNVFDALCAGAVGYLLKKTPPDELVAALRNAANGGSPMTPNIARKVISTFHLSPATPEKEATDRLTEREQQVLEQLAGGNSYAAIAEALDISLNGVRFHIRGIYEKLQVHSRSAAVAKGLKKRLLRPPR
ncbi:MAG: response regulator [Calditrichia bacterium]